MKQMSFTAVKNLIWRCRFLLVVLVFSLPAITDLLKPGYFSMHDDLQILRLQQLDKCVHDFQLPCQKKSGFGAYPRDFHKNKHRFRQVIQRLFKMKNCSGFKQFV